MTTEEKIAVMQAYVEGKKIQVRSCGYDLWRDCIYEPDWDWVSCDYRVKPEAQYRPYHSYREMVEDFCERFGVSYLSYTMPLIWLKSKKLGNQHWQKFSHQFLEQKSSLHFQNTHWMNTQVL